MRDFHIEEVVKEIQKELPIRIPRKLIRYLCLFALRTIIKVSKSDKNRVSLRKCDVHQVYKNYDVEAICNEFADLDETKQMSRSQIKSHKKHRGKENFPYSPMRSRI